MSPALLQRQAALAGVALLATLGALALGHAGETPLPVEPVSGAIRWERAVVGVLLEGRAFVPFDEVAQELAAALDPRTLAARRIGPIAHRDSPGVEGGYVSNGCVDCDALLGRFALEDLVREHLAGGGTYGQLDIGIPVELPATAPLRRAALA